MQNTKIGYLYRDASNYKKWNEVVIRGSISPEQISTIIDCLENEMHFIPRQVGLPEERFDEITEDDHAWFELESEGIEPTDHAATEDISVLELVENFIKAKNNWDECLFLAV